MGLRKKELKEAKRLLRTETSPFRYFCSSWHTFTRGEIWKIPLGCFVITLIIGAVYGIAMTALLAIGMGVFRGSLTALPVTMALLGVASLGMMIFSIVYVIGMAHVLKEMSLRTEEEMKKKKMNPSHLDMQHYFCCRFDCPFFCRALGSLLVTYLALLLFSLICGLLLIVPILNILVFLVFNGSLMIAIGYVAFFATRDDEDCGCGPACFFYHNLCVTMWAGLTFGLVMLIPIVNFVVPFVAIVGGTKIVLHTRKVK